MSDAHPQNAELERAMNVLANAGPEDTVNVSSDTEPWKLHDEARAAIRALFENEREDIEKWRKLHLEYGLELERVTKDLAKARAWFAQVSGALLDAGLSVGDETTYADAVRTLTKERDEAQLLLAAARSRADASCEHVDRLREQVAVLWRAAEELIPLVRRGMAPAGHLSAEEIARDKLHAALAATAPAAPEKWDPTQEPTDEQARLVVEANDVQTYPNKDVVP